MPNIGDLRPFDPAEPRKRGWSDRLFKHPSPDVFETEIEQWLATRNIADIYPAEVERLGENCQLGHSDRRRIATSVYRKVVQRFASDRVLTDAELGYLNALRRLLDIGEDDAFSVETELLHPVYEKAVRAAIAKGRLTVQDRQDLDALADALRISRGLRREIYRKHIFPLVQAEFNAVMEDHRLSPDEKEHLATVSFNLGVNISHDPETERRMLKYSVMWNLEHGGAMPEQETDFPLEREEICHYSN